MRDSPSQRTTAGSIGSQAMLDLSALGIPTFAAVMRLLALPNTKQLEQLEQPPQVQQ